MKLLGLILSLLQPCIAHSAAPQLTLSRIPELAQAVKSPRIPKSERASVLSAMKVTLKSASPALANSPDYLRAKFEIEQLEVFDQLDGCKSQRHLSESIQSGSKNYDPCIEGQQQPYQPGNPSIEGINQALNQTPTSKKPIEQSAYHHSVTDSIRNLLFLEIQEKGVRWSADEIKNRASLIVRDNCKNCTALDTKLITSHVTKSVMNDQRQGTIQFAPLKKQAELLCSQLKQNGYDFSRVPLSIDANSPLFGTLAKTNRDVAIHLNRRIHAIHQTLESGRESLLLLTHAMTDTKGSDPARIKLECLRPTDNTTLLRTAYQEAQSKIKEFLKRSKPDLKTLTQLAPRAVGEALYEDPSAVTEVCSAIQSIQESDAWDEKVEDIKLWGSLGVGAALFVTGVGAPAGATVMGTSLSLASLAAGTAVGIGVGAHDWAESQVMKEDSEILDAAAIAAGNDQNLAQVGREEWSRFENLRVSAMLNLGMSALDVALLAKQGLKAGRGLKAVNDELEKSISAKGNSSLKASIERSLPPQAPVDELEEILRNGDIVSIIDNPTNGKQLTTRKIITFKNGTRAIFKPDIAVYPTRYELVVSETDELMKLGVIPKKISRTIEGQSGSLQHWKEDATLLKNSKKRVKDDRISLLDYIFQNKDAGASNILISKNGQQFGIDHGMLLPLNGKPGSGLKALYEDQLPQLLINQDVRKALRDLDLDQFKKILERHLTPEETTEVFRKAKALKEKVVGKKVTLDPVRPRGEVEETNTAKLIESNNFDKDLTLDQVVGEDLRVQKQLTDMGVRFTPLPKSDEATASILTNELKSKGFKPFNSSLEDRFLMKKSSGTYQILPKDVPVSSGRVHPFEIAILHPEFKAYVQRLEDAGYKCVVDSSLGHSRMAAYYSPAQKIIGIKPTTKWNDFIHEYQHFEFRNGMDALDKKIDELIALRPSLFDEINDEHSLFKIVISNHADFKELIKAHPVLKDITELHRVTELPIVALDETLAVQKELNLLKKYGYVTCDDAYMGSRNYALDHQINELEKLTHSSELTPVQSQTLKRAIYEKAFLDTLKKKSIFGKKGAGVVMFSAATHQYLILQGGDAAVVDFK